MLRLLRIPVQSRFRVQNETPFKPITRGNFSKRSYSSPFDPESKEGIQQAMSETKDKIIEIAKEVVMPTTGTPVTQSVSHNPVTQAVPSIFDSVSDFPPVQWISEGLISLHSHTGLPWWVILPSLAIGVRGACYPLQYIAKQNASKNMATEHIRTLQRLFLQTKDQREKAKIRQKTLVLMREEGFRLWKNFAPLASIPVSLLCAAGIKLAVSMDPSMATGGLAWFQNLSVADPFWRLPWLLGLTSFISWEWSHYARPMVGRMGLLRIFVSALTLSLVPLTGDLPQAMHLYWISGAFLTLGMVGLRNKRGPPPKPPTVTGLKEDEAKVLYMDENYNVVEERVIKTKPKASDNSNIKK